MDQLNELIRGLAALLTGWKLPANMAEPAAKVLIYIIAVYIVLSVPVLAGRLLKKVERPIVIVEKLAEILMLSLSAAATVIIVLAVRNWEQVRPILLPEEIFASIGFLADLGRYVEWGLSVVLFLLIYSSIYLTTIKLISSMVRKETEANGVPMGIALSVYDLLGGFFWLALALVICSLILP